MNYSISMSPTCKKEAQCPIASTCVKIEPVSLGSYVPMTDRDDEVRTEIDGIAKQRTRTKQLSPCKEVQNPLKGRSIPMSWGGVRYIRAV